MRPSGPTAALPAWFVERMEEVGVGEEVEVEVEVGEELDMEVSGGGGGGRCGGGWRRR